MCKKLILIVLFVSFYSAFATDFSIKAKLEPYLLFSEKGNFADSGAFDYGFNRLKLYFTYREKLKSNAILESRLSFDFSHTEFENIVKEARFKATLKAPVSLGIGKYKPPFYYNDYCGSSKLGHIYRNATTAHLRDLLSIGGYQLGADVSYTLKELYSISVALFYNERFDVKGINGTEPFMMPLLELKAKPLPFLKLSYSAFFPEYQARLLDDSLIKERLALHSVHISAQTPKVYESTLDLFWGVDTARGRKLKTIHEAYSENLSFSLYTNHVFSFALSEKHQFITSLGGEFLNGLTYSDGYYWDRLFNYVLSGSLGLSYGKKLVVRTTFNEKFDRSGNALQQKRFALQLTYTPTLLKRKK